MESFCRLAFFLFFWVFPPTKAPVPSTTAWQAEIKPGQLTYLYRKAVSCVGIVCLTQLLKKQGSRQKAEKGASPPPP